MSTLSVVATAQPTNAPPRVKVDITDTGTPAINQVTVTRTDASGNTSVVRSPDGGPVQLVTSGSNRVATVYDYEMPYGVGVTYSTSEQPANTSSQVTVDVDRVWLVHPGVPSRSMPVELKIGSFDAGERSVKAGVFWPLGRENAVVVSDGRRAGVTSSFTVMTDTPVELAAVRSLIADAGVVQVNASPALGLGIDTAYVFIQDVRIKRRSDVGTAPQRDVEMPFVTVDAPIGGTQALWSWADVMARYGTWQDVMNANATWSNVLAPTN